MPGFFAGRSYKAVQAYGSLVTIDKYYKVLRVQQDSITKLAGLEIERNDGITDILPFDYFDVKDCRETAFVVGLSYKAQRDAKYPGGVQCLVIGNYYQVQSFSPEAESVSAKTETGDISSFSITYFDATDCKEDKERVSPFEVGKLYRAIQDSAKLVKGEFYRVQKVDDTDKTLAVFVGGLIRYYMQSYFDVKSGVNEVPVGEQVMTGRPQPRMNENFTALLTVPDKPKTYDTPGLFRYTNSDGSIYYTILAVSYDQASENLAGFIVDKGTSQWKMKDWNWTWQADQFTQIEGKLELNFTLQSRSI